MKCLVNSGEKQITPPDIAMGNTNHEKHVLQPSLGILAHLLRMVMERKYPGIPTTIKTMGVNITTIVYLRVLIIQIGSTIILMVVEA